MTAEGKRRCGRHASRDTVDLGLFFASCLSVGPSWVTMPLVGGILTSRAGKTPNWKTNDAIPYAVQ